MKKRCTRCHKLKSISAFYTRRYATCVRPMSACKECNHKKLNRWRDKNREKWNAYMRARYHRLVQDPEYRQRIRDNNNRSKDKRRLTPRFILDNRMGGQIRKFLTNKSGVRWVRFLDFGIKELKEHLEKQFLPGMSWDNIREWHIDHKIPISAFTYEKHTDDDFHRCWTLTNLQPLWKSDNWRKNDKMPDGSLGRLVSGKQHRDKITGQFRVSQNP